jgi:hypothetical protein
MASQEWIEIYSSYGSTELDTEIANLKSEITVYSSQALGSKSFTRDLAELKDRLHAAIRAQKSLGQTNVGNSGTTDFSGVNPEADQTSHGPDFYHSTVL